METRKKSEECTKSDESDEANHIPARDWIVGIALMIFSAILFSFNGVLIKWASDIGYKSMEIFVFRSGMQLFVTIIATLFVYDKSYLLKFKFSLIKFQAFKTIEKKLIKWIILRGIFAGIAGVCYFHAITIIPLGDAITVFSVYPVVTAFFGWIILKEKISIIHGIALCSAIVGVYLIANGTESQSVTTSSMIKSSWIQIYFGYIVSIMAALSGGLVFVFIRLSTKRTLPIILVYSHGFFCLLLSFLVGIIFQGFTWNINKTSDTILIIICFGIIGYFGQWTMNKSTQLIPAAVSSLIRSSDSVFSYIWQIVIFTTFPTIETIIGAICVIIGIFLVSLEKLRRAYRNKEKQRLNDDENNKNIMLNQYGTTNINSSENIRKVPVVFGSNLSLTLSLDPNDSQICLMAKQ